MILPQIMPLGVGYGNIVHFQCDIVNYSRARSLYLKHLVRTYSSTEFIGTTHLFNIPQS